MDTSLTEAGTQARMFDYFTATLAALPAGISLAQAAPIPNLEDQEPGITVPCDDNDQTDTGPINLQVGFWVHGVPVGEEDVTFEAFVDAFTAQGWSPVRDSSSLTIVRAYTPDGYALIAQLNPVGGLSLTGSSPCFPKANEGTTTPQPTAIPHPTARSAGQTPRWVLPESEEGYETRGRRPTVRRPPRGHLVVHPPGSANRSTARASTGQGPVMAWPRAGGRSEEQAG